MQRVSTTLVLWAPISWQKQHYFYPNVTVHLTHKRKRTPEESMYSLQQQKSNLSGQRVLIFFWATNLKQEHNLFLNALFLSPVTEYELMANMQLIFCCNTQVFFKIRCASVFRKVVFYLPFLQYLRFQAYTVEHLLQLAVKRERYDYNFSPCNSPLQRHQKLWYFS